MKKSLRKNSLRNDYFAFTAIMIVVIILISIAYTLSTYKSMLEVKEYKLRKASSSIEIKLREPFDYVGYLMRFMGHQILKNGHTDLSKISEMLQGELIINAKDKRKFSWEMFDWSKPDKKIIVSTPYGILKNPIDVSRRNYAKLAAVEPWVLHFDEADLGVTSGQWIIPAGMGIADENGNLIGILSMGFNVHKLSRNIEESIEREKISFIVLDQNYNIALSSTDNNPDKTEKDYFKSKLKGKFEDNGYNSLLDKVEYGDIIYSSYIKVDGYPYTILIGYNKAIATKEFKETLMPGIIGYTMIGLTALLLLLALRKLIIKPVIRLSEAADKISKGTMVKIPSGRTYEINNLALQLMKVRRSLRNEQVTRQKQKDLLKIIRDSENEKELFLRELYHAMNSPLNIVITGAELLKRKELGNDIDKYNEFFDMIYNAGRQLESYTTDILNPSEVNINEVIERCVRLHKRKATEVRLKMEIDIPNDIPPIFADELRIRQVIISTLSQAIFCIQDFGTIKISAKLNKKRNGKPNKLIIQIEDDGLGVNETERMEQWERAFGNPESIYSYSRNSDITRLSFPVIRHLVKLHKGTFELKAISGIGSTFIIILPYLTKKELETKPENISRTKKLSHSKEELVESLATNIIKFPRLE